MSTFIYPYLWVIKDGNKFAVVSYRSMITLQPVNQIGDGMTLFAPLQFKQPPSLLKNAIELVTQLYQSYDEEAQSYIASLYKFDSENLEDLRDTFISISSNLTLELNKKMISVDHVMNPQQVSHTLETNIGNVDFFSSIVFGWMLIYGHPSFVNDVLTHLRIQFPLSLVMGQHLDTFTTFFKYWTSRPFDLSYSLKSTWFMSILEINISDAEILSWLCQQLQSIWIELESPTYPSTQDLQKFLDSQSIQEDISSLVFKKLAKNTKIFL